MITSSIPTHAHVMTFIHRGVNHTYYIWCQIRNGVRNSGRWYWDAAGNQGVAESQAQAQEHARRWIKDGQ